jgi:hypothetical protein
VFNHASGYQENFEERSYTCLRNPQATQAGVRRVPTSPHPHLPKDTLPQTPLREPKKQFETRDTHSS